MLVLLRRVEFKKSVVLHYVSICLQVSTLELSQGLAACGLLRLSNCTLQL